MMNFNINKTTVIRVATHAAAFVAGGVVGYFGKEVVGKIKAKKAEKKAKTEAVEKSKKEEGDGKKEAKEGKGSDKDEEHHRSQPDLSDPDNRKKEYEARKSEVDEYKKRAAVYTSYSKKYADKEARMADLAVNEHPDDDTLFDDIPYSITGEQYLNEYPGFQKETWTYYMGDDTFADMHEEIIHDYERYLGYAPETFLDLGITGEDTVYVRNERLSTDYEIVKNRGSYRVEVLGEYDG